MGRRFVWINRRAYEFPLRLVINRWPLPRRTTRRAHGWRRPVEAGWGPVGLRAGGSGGAGDGAPPAARRATAPAPVSPARRVALALAALLAAAAVAVFLLDVLLWPTLRTLAQAEIQNTAVAGMYEAIREEMTETDTDYRELFRVETNQAGQVTFMQPDTVAINDFAARAALAIQDKVRELDGRTIRIPLGRALGSRLLGGFGPRIPVTLYPVMLENVRIWDTFEAAGINQTRHRIYLKVELLVGTAIPFIQSDVTVGGDFPIAEAVIVGIVPHTYVGGVWLPFFPDGGTGIRPDGSPEPAGSPSSGP